jgi:3-deoxy-7-phosphoheptulonate synthase
MADLVTWGAIGARTTESQVHRELASGLSMPVGFKNGTGGTVQIAADAVRSAAEPHHFLSVTKQGLAAIVATKGNPHCHVILRGGSNGPNYGEEAVASAVALLQKNGLGGRLMIDTSHANSGKDPSKQPDVAAAIGRQVAAGSRAIFGVMIESFLVGGRQEIRERASMTFGQSVTDGCLSWEATVPVLRDLAKAARERRSLA